MITKLLIANRGEIACRIIRTAKRLGIKTVAIYSDADQKSLHVRLADEAWYLGGSLASQSYLNTEKILEIAKQAQVSAIHPGYGFLSENPHFAQGCEANGITFVGPSVQAMHAMASKQFAKQLLEKTDVPLTPGYHGTNQAPEHLYLEAQKIGFPVLLKAAMGGGGKGMRSVFEQAQFYDALDAAKREALAYFKDDSMLIEKLVLNPRHVEIQIMADHHGEVVHLFERDCSIQRRHQKIIEEAPAPYLSCDLRQALANAALTVAQTIAYRGAGTVEFLVDPASESFYFMEMNTRLQVEHPVTEMITGLDLVEWQLRIAEGEPLPRKQKEIEQQGHAIECRLYAEDPEQGFIPSVGKIHFLDFPKQAYVRVDTGVETEDEVSQYYDAMFAKLIVSGQTRSEAIQRMQQALSSCHVSGIKTNLSFLQTIFQTPDFIHGHLHTDFLNTHPLTFSHIHHTNAPLFAAAHEYLQRRPQDPLFQDTFGWYTYTQGHWTKTYRIKNQSYTVKITPCDLTAFIYHAEDGRTEHVEIVLLNQHQLQLILDKQTITATIIQNKPNELTLFTSEGTACIEITTPNYTALAHETSHSLCAPMPSTVVAVLKNTGESVQKGESLMILEAMKMEHTIHAPEAGQIDMIFFNVGSQVQEGAILASITPSQDI